VSAGRLPEDLKTSLMLLRCNIFLHAGPNENTKSRIRAETSDSCKGASLCAKRYISFLFPAFKKKVVAKEEVVQRLFDGQNKLCLPSPKNLEATPSYPAKLYNFIVDAYHKEELGVQRSDLGVLEELTRETRDIIQSLHIRVKQSQFPTRFKHDLKKFENNRCRTSSSKLKSKASVLSEVTSRSAFLLKDMWCGFHEDILLLQELTQKTLEEMQRSTDRTQKNQKKTDRSIGGQLRQADVIEPTRNPANRYLPVQEMLSATGNYQELLVSSDLIDTWSPPAALANETLKAALANETLEAARQRRSRFRSGMKLAFPYHCIKFDAGGRRELIFLIWKIPTDPLHRCKTSDANVMARIVEKLPCYASRHE
jgi:hypothetical protein